MAPVILVALQTISFIAANQDTVKQLITNVEQLIPTAVGNEKAAAVKTFIGTALGIEAQLEAAWPMVAPFFNLFVTSVKAALHPTAK